MKPIEVKALGDYYCTPNLRKWCHAVKKDKGCGRYGKKYTPLLANIINPKTTIVPVPSNNGRMERIAIKIAKRIGCSVNFCLEKSSNISRYQSKKIGLDIEPPIKLVGKIPDGDITLLDNVIATGKTMRKCMSLVGKPCYIAAIAIDCETLGKEGNGLYDKQLGSF